jgi:S1-C subfamily serine protease
MSEHDRTSSLLTTDPLPGGNGKVHREQPPHGPGGRPPLLWLLMIALLGFAGGVGGYLAADQLLDDDDSSGSSRPLAAQPSNPAPLPKRKLEQGETYTPGEIYAQASPAVVYITAKVRVQSESFFGVPQEQEGISTGSGFVIDQDGHIVTNAHVVQDAFEIEVGFNNDKTLEAELVGQDQSTDIAVLKVKAEKRQLHSVGFADSTKIQVGDPVVAIGNPFGLDRTLTTGVVSALQREIPGLNGFKIEDVIQTDAAINPGNSGGPLLNMLGQVIGVNSQIQSKSGGNEGIGFAVPSNTVDTVVRQIIEDGSVERAYIGITGLDIDDTISRVFNLPVDKGVMVQEVSPGSPADEAGNSWALGGSIIVEFDGQKVTSMRQIVDRVNDSKVGDEVEVVYYDGNDKKTTKVELAKRPEGADDATNR